MDKNCRKDGRNLEKMGLEGLNIEQIKTYLEKGERPDDCRFVVSLRSII